MQATGIQLPSIEQSNREDWIERVQMVEEQGLETVWAGEAWGQSSVPFMTQLAERTDTIDVCSGIFNIYSRTPALVAQTASGIANVADGRFRVGLGASGPAVIENFHGVEFESPLRRTREYIEIVRGYLAGETVDYDGEFFEVSGFSLDTDEFYDLPIYVASMGEVNRQLTGEFADGWIPLLVPHTAMEEALEPLARGAERGGRTIDDLDIAPWIPTCISEDRPDEAKEHVRSLIAFYVGAMGTFYHNAVSEFGFPDEADDIKEGWANDRQAGAEEGVTDEMLDAFTVYGTPDEAEARFQEFVDAGVDSPIAYIPAHWAPEDLVEETLTHL